MPVGGRANPPLGRAQLRWAAVDINSRQGNIHLYERGGGAAADTAIRSCSLQLLIPSAIVKPHRLYKFAARDLLCEWGGL